MLGGFLLLTFSLSGLIAFVFVLPLLSPPILRPTIARFSSMALACVAILTISGVYAATLRLTAFSDLWTSDYGRTLFAKLVLFGVTIAFGAYHLLIVPFVGEQAAADVRVALRVEPAALGTNTLHVAVMDANGKPRDVQRVQMTVEMTTMDRGETKIIADSASNGTYSCAAQQCR